MPRILDGAVLAETDKLGYSAKQEVREKMCNELINVVHEDGAWYKAMQSAMKDHRRDEFPCMDAPDEDDWDDFTDGEGPERV